MAVREDTPEQRVYPKDRRLAEDSYSKPYRSNTLTPKTPEA